MNTLFGHFGLWNFPPTFSMQAPHRKATVSRVARGTSPGHLRCGECELVSWKSAVPRFANECGADLRLPHTMLASVRCDEEDVLFCSETIHQMIVPTPRSSEIEALTGSVKVTMNCPVPVRMVETVNV